MKTEQELRELYNKTNGLDRELFIQQVLYFRKIMGSTAYTLEQKEEHFQNVAEAYFRCNLTKGDKIIFEALADEFQMRCGYELFTLSGNNKSGENE